MGKRAPNKPIEEHIQMIMNSYFYKSEEPFKAHVICSLIGTTQSRATAILNEMVKQKILRRHHTHLGNKGCIVTYTQEKAKLTAGLWPCRPLHDWSGEYTPRWF